MVIVPVITDNVRRVDSQLLRSNFCVPAIGEGLPRTRHFFNLKLSKVRLEQLLLIITELHVEVAVEAAFGILLGGLQNGKALCGNERRNQFTVLNILVIFDYRALILFIMSSKYCSSNCTLAHLKNISRWLLEDPSLGVVVRDYFHRDRQVTIANENIDGLADAQKRFRLARTLFGGECGDECQSKNEPSRVSHNIRAMPWSGLMQSANEKRQRSALKDRKL